MTAQRSTLPLEFEVRQENEGWRELTWRKVLKPAPSDPELLLTHWSRSSYIVQMTTSGDLHLAGV